MQFPANNLITGFSLQDFDLSRNKSLRALEVPARHIVSKREPCAPSSATLSFLMTTLPTITSPAFSEVVIVYRDRDFSGVGYYPLRVYRKATPADRATEASWHRRLFEVFRKTHAIRDFRLVLCADVWGRMKEYTVGELECAVAVEKAAKRLDYLPSEPLVIHSPRGSWNFGG